MIESPCIDVCRMSEAHGVCAGCYRTLDEIARWVEMGEAERARVMAELPQRRRILKPEVIDLIAKADETY